VALAAIALRTEKLRLGTMVTPLPRRRPWQVARQTVSLDQLSNGRLVLGVGSGAGAREFDNFGEETSPKIRAEMLDEGLDIMQGLWSAAPFAYQGKHFRLEETQFVPGPVQQPRIPVWVGGRWPGQAPFRRAARWDGVIPILREENEDAEVTALRDCIRFVQDLRQSDAPFDVAYIGMSSPDNAQATADVQGRFAEAGATWWLELITPRRFGLTYADEWPAEAFYERIERGPELKG
jgi:alkanesulfonate monooxygenase SsuD/methylene tetrahydromethanopterin reductase-like flavin-dependent oxidoreductase (luciferase family)